MPVFGFEFKILVKEHDQIYKLEQKYVEIVQAIRGFEDRALHVQGRNFNA